MPQRIHAILDDPDIRPPAYLDDSLPALGAHGGGCRIMQRRRQIDRGMAGGDTLERTRQRLRHYALRIDLHADQAMAFTSGQRDRAG